MIDALIQGRLIRCVEQDNLLVGRIVYGNDQPVQFTARRGTVKTALKALTVGMPLSVAGPLTSYIKRDAAGAPYIFQEILITAVLTAQPKGLFGSIL